jgi:hypothetical protein
MNAAPRVARWELLGLALCVAAFLLLRLPLYIHPGILLGWHSDAALLGLMARAMVHGDVPLLFWGSDYLWPLTSVFAAIAGKLLGDVGPLALRLGTAAEVIGALMFFHAALRGVVGPRAALLTTFWLVAGPAFLFKLTFAPLSAEQYFFLGAIVFWFVRRTRFVRLHHWLILGLLTGFGWWIHRGVIFAVIPSLAVIFWYDRKLFAPLTAAITYAAGVAIGVLPLVFGRLAIDQRLYAPVVTPWHVSIVWQRIADIATSDLWSLLGGIGIGVIFVALLVSAIVHFEPRRETVLAAGIVIIAFAFWIFSAFAYRGAVRYVMVTLPILYAFSAAEILRLPDRRLAIGLAAAIAIALFVPRYIDVREVAAAHREQFENWGGFDPRPALRQLAAGHYTVCYADVWVAHKLEWLSEPTIPFIPYRSVNRRMTESLRLAALPGPKCFVDKAGRVRALTAREQNDMRLETLRLAEGARR